jgi:hypothetical protein
MGQPLQSDFPENSLHPEELFVFKYKEEPVCFGLSVALDAEIF